MTLLSYHESTGPASAWDGDPDHGMDPTAPDYAIWKAFVEYEDSDGYYPPTPFKVLRYFPQTGTYAVSGIYERYAFDTYYTIDLSAMTVADTWGEEAAGQAPVLKAEKNYNYTWELIFLAARIVITILLELGLALLFGYRHKKQLCFPAAVNVITQVVLNVLLNVVNYRSGHWNFVFYYVLLELLVLAIEAAEPLHALYIFVVHLLQSHT